MLGPGLCSLEVRYSGDIRLQANWTLGIGWTHASTDPKPQAAQAENTAQARRLSQAQRSGTRLLLTSVVCPASARPRA
jgi:hypothetical protein